MRALHLGDTLGGTSEVGATELLMLVCAEGLLHQARERTRSRQRDPRARGAKSHGSCGFSSA